MRSTPPSETEPRRRSGDGGGSARRSERGNGHAKPAPRQRRPGGRTAAARLEEAEAALREMGEALRALRQGDFTVRLHVPEGRSPAADAAAAFNDLAALQERWVTEFGRVASAVGESGRLNVRAQYLPVGGGWAAATRSLNQLIEDHAWLMLHIREVVLAFAGGDFTRTVPLARDGHALEGDFLALATVVNDVVGLGRTISLEFGRVVRELGTAGSLGARANVPEARGGWKDLTDSVNRLSENLTAQLRSIAVVTTAVANGDLSQKVDVEAQGEIRELKQTINTMVDQLRTFASEVTRVAREVGTEGKLGVQADVRGVAGTWRDLTDSVNRLAGNLTAQVRNIAQVSTAIARGDLSQKIEVEARGEIKDLKETINTMVDQLRTFAAEVSRVAREVGTEGRLGGQADVPGVDGTWKDLTENVNQMAGNLTDQVRGISDVVTAVANGDLSKRLLVVAKGEIAQLADTINAMTDTLRTFAEQVTTVAREVGTEGRLGGQAQVPGASGTWKGLTDNVNQLAANLTTQVRAISEVAIAVARGDLSRTISVEARGEVLALKDTINEMIARLRDTTRANDEQDWLKTNIARFFGMMQGQRSLDVLARLIVSEVTPLVGGQHAAFYVADGDDDDELRLRLVASYAYTRRKRLASEFRLGEGLVGQCAVERKPILVTDIPPDYVRISSALGEAVPHSLVALPILFEGRVRGVFEIASFHIFNDIELTFLEQLMLNLGVVMNLIGASARTEELLGQLQRSNTELETRKTELEDKAEQLEVKNREIAEASRSLEDQASELARVSQYKSQFLANMSHEIRTPLNSMLILAQMLESNADQNLTGKQVEYAETIHAAGRDLLALINQILDLSKVEAGRMEIHPENAALAEVTAQVDRTFRATALQKGITFDVTIDPQAPAVLLTDRQLLLQILKNLVGNAIKFTQRGSVSLRIGPAPASACRRESLAQNGGCIAFAVGDTGIGIDAAQLETIFEAFQQGDSGTARRFGGTGLGLTISREYAKVLGGEIQVRSAVGEGSTFTLYLPASRELARPAAEALGAPESAAGEQAEVAAPLSREPLTEEQLRSLAGRHVVLVDDDPRNLYATTGALERYGLEVHPASSGEEALAQLEDHPETEVVLMDVMMPGMDGYEATRRIRANPRFAHVPVVGLSAKASRGDAGEGMRAGMVDFVVKPVEIPQLVSVIWHHLS